MSFRLSVLREVGGFNPAFRTNAEDVDVSLRLRRAGYRLRYLPDARVYHQRTDDEASLKRAMAAWYGAAYRARWVNNAQTWKLFAGGLRRLVLESLFDLVVERDKQMARLSWQVGWIRLSAMWKERRVLRQRILEKTD
ncbi:MAG: glycosyltransferase family 2 protein, partial [Anaerolineae bacterium]